jgi:hypothetical protein
MPPSSDRPGQLPPPKDADRPLDPSPPIDPLARAPEAGTQPAATFNPNMFGDLFGARPQPLLFLHQRRIQTILSGPGGQSVVFAQLGPQGLAPLSGQSIVLRDNGRISGPFRTNFATVNPITGAGNLPLVENAEITSRLQALNPGADVVFVGSESTAIRLPRLARPNAPGFVVKQGYDVTSLLATSVMLPNGGGVVGRTKVADDNFPLPTDRVIFHYDYFNSAVIAPGGFDVYRFAVGGEMTAFDGMASAEVRVPFASTLDPISNVGVTNRETVFGDAVLILKGLLFNSGDVIAAAGVGFAFPTAPDTVVRDPLGADIVRIRNQSYFVTPYIAAAATPADGFFVQAWVQASFDATGSEVAVAAPGTGVLHDVGRARSAALLQTDVQLGYWLYRDAIAGIAPFVELHYNRPLESGSVVPSNGFVLGDGGSFNELNLTLGAAAVVRPSLMVSVGLVLPLRDGRDGFFDYQFGIRANWFFGPYGRGL